MALLDIPLDKITEADLQRLITAGAAESLYIEYKQQTYGGDDKEHAEFLADVSSFANAAGGDLVIGMTADKGAPTNFLPFTGDADKELLRLEGIARTGLEPRIPNLRAKAIPLAKGGACIIVRAPKSYHPPHRVNYKNRLRFWARASSGKYEPNVEELRHIFNDAPLLAERIRAFHLDRVAKITAGETPVQMPSGGKVVLHVVPLPSFADNRLADIVSLVTKGTGLPLPLEGTASNRSAVNLEGFLNYTDIYPGTGSVSYAQFFRSGAIEGVSELPRREAKEPYLIGPVVGKVKDALIQYLDTLRIYGAGLPVYAFLSLCDVRKCCLRYGMLGGGWGETSPLNRDVITFPEIFINSTDANVPALLSPTFNMLWNAFGFPECDWKM